jgi:hypothetical protein
MLVKKVVRLSSWLWPLVLIGCSFPGLPGQEPPLAKDLQSLCLKSHLGQEAFRNLATQTPGMENPIAAPGPYPSEQWAHRIDGKVLLVIFINLSRPSGSTDALGACMLDDPNDRGATVKWLAGWTGADVQRNGLFKYYLVVGPGRPQLIPKEASTPRPKAPAGGEVYTLRIASVEKDTNLDLIP